MKFNPKAKDINKYAYVILSLIITFWVLSIIEVYINVSNGVTFPSVISAILYKITNDFWAGILISIVLFPICFLISGKKNGFLITKIVVGLIVLIQFGLVKYSLTTLLNLGADLLGYSYDDIVLTIGSSEQMSILYFLPFVIFPAIFFGLFFLLHKYVSNRKMIALFAISILFFGGVKVLGSQSSDTGFQNKLYFFTSDIIKFQLEKNELNAMSLSGRSDYPLLKPFKESKDVLAPFFNLNDDKPNIVFIIVEGLGSEFMDGNSYSGFTPYLDSLVSKSLYWENFVSTTGRTFGVLPSLLASLPYGESGFLEIPKPPSHISLISVLKANGYMTSYFSGDQSSFDKKINFLEYNGIENVIDESKYESDYTKTEGNSGGFSWGYPDAEIFKKTLASLKSEKQPRLDIIMTLSNHEPFNFPLKETFELKVDSLLNSGQKLNITREEVLANKDIYTTLYYTDNSIKNFMNSYAKRDEYKNTIFIITGDHRLIPINQKDKLCRFHVPLFIYSPLLKKAERFKSISSHWDVTPSLMAFLMNNYKFNNLQETTWMSKGLDTAREFRNIHQIPLMRYKGSINDFIYKEHLYSDGELYKINENFGTFKVKNTELLKTMSDSLKEFKKMNAYITQRNKLFPDSLNIYVKPSKEFSKEEIVTIKKLTKGLTFDETFIEAREKAFNKERKTARLLCDYILNELPNHADARTLKGRTLAWDGSYYEAEIELLNVIKRSPYYFDSYLALLDLYWWSDQDEKSVELAKKAVENEIKNSDLSFKLAKAYQRMNKKEKAVQLIDSILKINPLNKEYQSFKQTLK